MSDLRVSETLALPIDFVTARVSLVGMSGAGKSNAFADMIEEVHAAQGLFVLVDPLGAAWGMRSNVAGDGPGLPVPIFGGYHADVTITPQSGELVARELYHADANGIVDLSAFGPREACLFYAALTHEFMALHRKQKKPRAFFVDEAALLMPERQSSDAETASLDAGWRMHTGGRALGLGLKTATQSAAEQAKRTMKQSELFVALRTFAPIDQKPILDYLRTSVETERANEIKKTLAKLKDGEAWFISPHWLGICERARFRLRETFDSARTPKVGETIAPPKVLAPVDLARISAAIAATMPEAPTGVKPSVIASADVVAAMQRRAEAAESDWQAAIAERDAARRQRDTLIFTVKRLGAAMTNSSRAILTAMEELAGEVDRLSDAVEGTTIVVDNAAGFDEGSLAQVGGHVAVIRGDGSSTRVPRETRIVEAVSGEKITPACVRILTALAQRDPKPLSRRALGFLCGQSPKSSSYTNNLSWLNARGYIRRVADGELELTSIGKAVVPNVGPPATSAAMHAEWLPRFVPAQRRILETLLKAWPKVVDRESLARLSEASPNSSSFANNLAAMNSIGVIERVAGGLRAHDDMFPTGKPR